MRKIWVLMRKEWSEVFKNKLVLFTTAFLPLMFAVLALVTLHFTIGTGEVSDFVMLGDMPPEFAAMCRGLTPSGCMQYYVVSQFMLLFMMVPMIVPITFASYSIVGEKTTRTLEPLLATPIRTTELLAGKSLAAVVPGVLATYLAFLIFAIGASLMAVEPGVVAKFFDPLWMTAIIVGGSLLAILGVSLAVMSSSRVNDPRVAEQVSGLFVLPLIGLFVAQSLGFIFLNAQVILWMVVILFVLDAGLLYFATQLFQRETILTRWK